GGGGIRADGGTLRVSGSTVSGNSSEIDGGGIWIHDVTGTVTLTNDTITSNTCTGPGGGVYIFSGSTVYLDSFTVANIINNTDPSGLNGSTANIDGPYTLLQ